MKLIAKILKVVTIVSLVMLFFSMGSTDTAKATSFGISPTHQKVALVPGQTYHGSFKITNPAENTEDFSYSVEILPFYKEYNEDSGEYETTYEEKGNYSQITKWVTLENQTGLIEPNSTQDVFFSINVPDDAPAGGQYVALAVSSNQVPNANGNMNIQQILQFAHLVYADVAGETIHGAEILDMDMPSFLLSGNISGAVTIKNSGNTHISEESILQVFPLFSNEEIYTNEENPTELIVTPDSTRIITEAWHNTPNIGIYRALFTVRVDGEAMGEIEKIIIICPIWFMFIIVFAIIALIIWIVLRAKSRKSGRKAEN